MILNNMELKNGMQLRSRQNYGPFYKKGRCYPVVEHDEFTVVLEGYHYRLTQEELDANFELAVPRSLSEKLSIQILDCFENLLDKHGIVVPDEDRSGDDGEACLYGMTYARLQEEIAELLSKYTD